MIAGGLVRAMFGHQGALIDNINTLLASGVSTAQGLFVEMFLTMMLVFAVLMLAVEKSKDTFIAPIGIGLALFVAELTGNVWTFSSSSCSSSSSSRRRDTKKVTNKQECRRVFHGRLAQPSAQLWLCRGFAELPRVPLDILAWAGSWGGTGRGFLPLRQVGALRGGKPWTGQYGNRC